MSYFLGGIEDIAPSNIETVKRLASGASSGNLAALRSLKSMVTALGLSENDLISLRIPSGVIRMIFEGPVLIPKPVAPTVAPAPTTPETARARHQRLYQGEILHVKCG